MLERTLEALSETIYAKRMVVCAMTLSTGDMAVWDYLQRAFDALSRIEDMLAKDVTRLHEEKSRPELAVVRAGN